MADERGAIEVKLSILSGQESAAFREIQQTAKQVSEMMQMFKSRDFVEAAERLAKVHAQMVASSAQMNQVSKQMESRERQGGVRGVLGGLTQKLGEKIGGQRVDETKAHEKLAEDQKQAQADRENSRKDTDRQRQLGGMTDVERASFHARERFGGRIAMPGQPTIPGTEWADQIESLNPDVSGIRLPQFGEITVQQILAAGRQNRLNKASSATSADDMNRYGTQAGRIDAASRQAGNIGAIRQAFRLTQRHVTGPIQGITGRFDETPPMGFHRDSNPISDIFGFQTPFSAYGQESAREQRDTIGMRFSAGINGQQASAITQASLAAGFSGQMGSDVRRSLMAPAVRQMNIDPNALIPYTQALRTGTASIADLNTVITALGEGARSARMGVNEYAQAVAQSGEQAQASGGMFLQGAQFGQTFSNSTGLNPQVGTQLIQNQVVQGYLSARTGLPGRLGGAASPLAQQRSIEQALKDRVSAYSGTMPSSREPIYGADGQIIGYDVTSSQDAAIGAAAQDLGIDQEQAKAILNRKGESSVANFDAAARQYLKTAPKADAAATARGVIAERNKKGGEGGIDAIVNGAANSIIPGSGLITSGNNKYRYNAVTGKIEAHGGGVWGDVRGWHTDQDATDEYNRRLNKPNDPRSISSLRQVHELAMKAGVSQSDWRKEVDQQADPAKQMANAQRLVQDRAIEANDPNAIKFTGPAAKFFEALVDKNKNLAGASALSGAAVATSSAGPSPLTGQSTAAGSLGGLSHP